MENVVPRIILDNGPFKLGGDAQGLFPFVWDDSYSIYCKDWRIFSNVCCWRNVEIKRSPVDECKHKGRHHCLRPSVDSQLGTWEFLQTLCKMCSSLRRLKKLGLGSRLGGLARSAMTVSYSMMVSILCLYSNLASQWCCHGLHNN